MRLASLLIAAVLAPAFAQATALPAGWKPPARVLDNGKYSVIGSGSTYDAAYKDAQNRLPSGAQVTTIRTKQDGSTWYVTIFYN
jgi:streptogramin lyase